MSANAGSGQPSATIGKPSRRSTVATVRAASGLSAVRKFRQTVATVCRPLPMIPAGDLSGKASRAATVRAAPPVSDSGEHRNAATVRGIDSGMSRGQAVATVCRPLPMIPANIKRRHHRTRASRPALDRKRRPFDRAGSVRALSAGKPWRTSERRAAGFRQAVRPVSGSTVRRVPRPASDDSGNRSTVATVRPWQPFAPVSDSGGQGFRRPCAACKRASRGEHRTRASRPALDRKRQPFDRPAKGNAAPHIGTRRNLSGDRGDRVPRQFFRRKSAAKSSVYLRAASFSACA